MTELVLPWPPKELSPNARLHHMALYRAKRAYSDSCMWQAMEQGLRASKAQRLHVELEFFKPNRRAMDLDNLFARMKAGIDGLSKVLKVDDSRWSYSIKVSDQIGGMVRVRITEVKA